MTAALDSPTKARRLILSASGLTKSFGAFADEPTKGIDVATKDDSHALLLRLAERGVGILISSDQPEVHRLADRILVMRRGQLVGELAGDAGDERVIALASGARA